MNPEQFGSIAVVGLGYVGLPLAVEFGKKYKTLGYDICKQRISSLRDGIDHTREIPKEDLFAAKGLSFTNEASSLGEADIIIVTVPTPIDKANRPDLKPLISASQMIGGIMKHQCLVIYESTVYPGLTEEICVPELEKYSNGKLNQDFFVGSSPERINPGDKTRQLKDIVKITSGSTPEIAIKVDALYASIVEAGTHMTSSIKVAEAAKVIENTQRDLNIALINELSMIFSRLEIDTHEVLNAAATKWNFIPFKPGLVGGHCIGVDPYYLTFKAEQVGYYPEVILSGRRINDTMAVYLVSELIKKMVNRDISISAARTLIIGFTFKENCSDIRNTKVINIYRELKKYSIDADILDPEVSSDSAWAEYGVKVHNQIEPGNGYDAVILAVPHNNLMSMGVEGIRRYLRNENSVLFDVKGVLDPTLSDLRL